MRASEGGVVLVCIRLLFTRSLPTSGLKLLHYKFRVSFYDAGVLITDGSSALGTTLYGVPCSLPLYKCLLNTVSVL